VVVVNVPGSTQAQISIGNVALARADADYLRLRVANQVLGGSASARLFMNLRERCSYSYGVYSSVASRLGAAPHSTGGAVESRHTAGALREIFAELASIRETQIPAAELDAAREYMVGYFPIITETAGNLAELVTLQRVLDLPADYWSTYRSNIAAVTAAEALAAAQRYVQPDHALIVIVGDATQIAEPARRWGHVTVVDIDGREVQRLEAAPDAWPGGEPEPCAEPPARASEERPADPPRPSLARDFDFPDAAERTLANGLEVVTIERRQLPLVYLRLVVRAGSASDPL
jgi:predicted Zn-dependent peptidase